MTDEIRENELEPQPERSMKTPGAMLRDARREKKLSQEDVSKQLRLSVRWIKDLENNDYSRAAALIYVRGYLRSYARLMDLSPDDVVAAFTTLGLEENYLRDHDDVKVIKHQSVPIISKSTRILVSRRTLRWLSSSALVVLVVLVGIWWQGQKKHGGEHQATVVMQQSQQQQPKQDLQIQTVTPTAADANPPAATDGDSAVTQGEDSTPAQNANTAAVSADNEKNKTTNTVMHRRKSSNKNVDLPAP
jgi:cytoskeletal protein RodZ